MCVWLCLWARVSAGRWITFVQACLQLSRLCVCAFTLQVLGVKWKGDQLWGTIEILPTPAGLLLWELYSQVRVPACVCAQVFGVAEGTKGKHTCVDVVCLCPCVSLSTLECLCLCVCVVCVCVITCMHTCTHNAHAHRVSSQGYPALAAASQPHTHTHTHTHNTHTRAQGIKLGVSSRGWASLRTDARAKCVFVDDDFELITFDFVTEPSTKV
jgi:hypothetical protein